MTIEIVPIRRHHIAGFRAVLDDVARERRYLALLAAPPAAQVRRFVLGNIRNHHAQFVALDGEQLVGWCDVIPKARDTLQHSGTLGMGVAASHRGAGIGSRLLQATLDAATVAGLSRVELIVRVDNTPAIALYRRFGFETEGHCRRYLRVDDAWHDALLMARVR
ncbi:MAG TPA: GNAT family N-acetyltransferase [Steroidobacteraceae bacterium]